MNQMNAQQSTPSGSGKAFFDRADQVAETGNWDFAIELYLEGIAREPGNLERGHRPLREVALKRKAMGGKGPGLLEKLKGRGGKGPNAALVSAEYMLAKDPSSTVYMEQVLKAAVALNQGELVKWICDILLEIQRQAPKRNRRLLQLLTDSYSGIEEYASAIQACEMARELAPGDTALQNTLQTLSAKYTIKKGKYDQEGSFVRSVKDMDEQQRLVKQDALVKDKDFLLQQIEQAKNEYLTSSTVPGKVSAYVDALTAPEDEALENQAIEVLQKAFQEIGAYQFKMRIGDIRIRQMNRRRRKALEDGDKEAAAELARKQVEFELQEFTERSANYPTELSLKYELGRRLLAVGRYDEAISHLQLASRDPRRHVAALNFLGQAFARKGWHRESADTYEKALAGEMGEEMSKELRYNLGHVLEKMGDLKRAQDVYSLIAQMDYNYKDVRQRLEDIRGKLSSGG